MLLNQLGYNGFVPTLHYFMSLYVISIVFISVEGLGRVYFSKSRCMGMAAHFGIRLYSQ